MATTLSKRRQKISRKMNFGKSTKPVKPQTATYHRQPTTAEIKFGHGATHYKDFPLDKVTKADGTLKAWIVCPEDGLRYYR